jgi:surfactin synthase thioesterase subunit
VVLWGHSSGTATAVATARALEARGVPVRRVFLAAQLLGDADRRRAAVAELSTLTDADIAARLAADGGYTALAELDAPRAAHVGAAYRHDCTAAHRWFLDRVLDPAGTPAGGVPDPGPAPAVRLAAPVTVVVAADDPTTADAARRHAQWRVLADEVDLHELPDGGHHFLRTRPERAAEVVAHAVLAPSR